MAGRPPRITPSMCAHGRNLAEPRLAPDAMRVAFVASQAGRAQLVVVPTVGGAELVVTSQPAPRGTASFSGGVYDWTPDGTTLVYAAVDGGLWAVPSEGGPSRCIAAPSALGSASAPTVSPDGTRVAYVVDQQHVAVVALDGSGWPVRLSDGADFCFDPSWTTDSAAVLWHEWDVPAMPWDEGRIKRRVADAREPATLLASPGASVQQPRSHPSGRLVSFLCDETGWLNLTVASMDGTGRRTVLEEPCEHGDPSWGLGQRSYAWSPDGSRVAFCRNEAGFGSLHVLDVTTGEQRRLGKGVHGGLSWVAGTIAAMRSGARTPTQVVVYDVDSGARTTLARGPVGGFDAADLPEPESVTWLGEDGERVHGRLYRPNPEVGSASGGELPPLLVWIHGGPTGQWPVQFMARQAYFLDRGWAILLPDHRGSTGHGRDYMTAMRGRWGELDVADVAAGIRAAATEGWADPGRIAVMGGSSGGFTVLGVLAHHPELCAAGVDVYGVADLLDLDETTHRFEAHYLHSIVGPLPEAVDRYRERSPVNLAERITAPLLILQGTDDKVVPPAQSRAIADRLQRLGRTVEVHFYEGEGHGWGRPETVEDELVRIESFLRRHVLRWRNP